MTALTLRLHIGLPKCASTSLQHHLHHSGHPGYLGKFMGDGRERYRSDRLKEIFRKVLPFAAESQLDMAALRSDLRDELKALDPDRTDWTISDELLSGFGFATYYRNYRIDPSLLFARLRRLCDRLVLLVVTRRQRDYLRSYYRQMIRQGYNVAYELFQSRQLQDPMGLAVLLDYDRYLAAAAGACDELVVIPFEALIDMDEMARAELARFGVTMDQLPRANTGLGGDDALEALKRNVKQPLAIGATAPAADFAATVMMLHRASERGQFDALLEASGETEARWSSLIRASNTRLAERYDWVDRHGYER